MDRIQSILEFKLFQVANYSIEVYSLVVILFILAITKALLWVIHKTLFTSGVKKTSLDTGNAYALFQIIKYIIWVISVALMLESIGVKVTVLLAGSAALLVGLGLGLQHTFNDVVSGIILLSERSIMVDDILEIDGDIVKIQEIGLRTSKGLNRDDISIIIPNSLITTNKVINWSHQSNKTRFKIAVGVAYGSDVELVLQVLEEAAKAHPDVDDSHMVKARLMDFGDSALHFELYFFSKNIFRIIQVKSDIRVLINKKFKENNILIPFPQMDVYVNPR